MRDGDRGRASRFEPEMRRSLYDAHYDTFAARTPGDHSHPVRVNEQRADHLCCIASGAAGASRCEVGGKQLAQHSGRGIAINSHRVGTRRVRLSSFARCSLTSLHRILLFGQSIKLCRRSGRSAPSSRMPADVQDLPVMPLRFQPTASDRRRISAAFPSPATRLRQASSGRFCA